MPGVSENFAEMPTCLTFSPLGAFDLDDHVAREHLRIVRHFVEREHPAGADVALAQNLEPFVARFGFEDLGEDARDLGGACSNRIRAE